MCAHVCVYTCVHVCVHITLAYISILSYVHILHVYIYFLYNFYTFSKACDHVQALPGSRPPGRLGAQEGLMRVRPLKLPLSQGQHTCPGPEPHALPAPRAPL